ncbi:LysR family transcriptional regulator [Anaerosphaera multitolerans]|uniref:LysR family transcriptional regulator n=1 Tax=Anaerosphaera multitolerans TaxID=2487351 RepID=A0A437S4J7_9FIRM|nr:LysR family transcriptional regulator [Anaerosphaera multitolerans]RVU53943.1 LysR family transcriptional regulator [Anaerosphaera multitolerans]
MNFLSMHYFITLERERSFTKAANELHITQQTLSANIAGIEEELNCKLFIRQIPLKLTYAGKVFLDYALDFQRKYTDMTQEFYDISNSQRGVLKIGVGYTRGRTILPQLISEFQKKYPNIEIQLFEATNIVLHQILLKGEVDLAIANFPKNLPKVELKDFYEEEVVFVISKELIRNLYGFDSSAIIDKIEKDGDFSKLANCPFLLTSKEDVSGRIGRELLSKADFKPIVKAQSSSVDTLLELCVRNVGACFLPEKLLLASLTENELENLEIIHFKKDSTYMIRFGWLKHSYSWSMITRFMDFAYEILNKDS